MTITATSLALTPHFPYAFSICTLVTDKAQYQRFLTSFENAGFNNSDCEFLYIDNSENNQADAYQGINRMIHAASGRYLICCHQDILLDFDQRPTLEQQITILEQQDPNWAILGNAGGTDNLGIPLKVRITDPHADNRHSGSLPARVLSLDENFLVLKKTANLGLSHDLKGFHHYGTDFCLHADMLGFHCYVIDFHLRHLSAGTRSPHFYHSKKLFINRYQQRLRSRWLRSPCTPLFLSNSSWRNSLCNCPLAYRWVKKWHKFKNFI